MSVKKDITFARGEDVLIRDTVTGESIGSWTLRAVIRRSPSDPTILIEKDNGAIGGITFNDAANGVFDIRIADADTIGLFPGAYVWEVKRMDAGNEAVLTTGILTLVAETVR